MAADFLCLEYQQQLPAFWLQGVFVPVPVGCVPGRVDRYLPFCQFLSCTVDNSKAEPDEMGWSCKPWAGPSGVLLSESWRTWHGGQCLASTMNLLTWDTGQVNHLGFGFLHIMAGTMDSPWKPGWSSLAMEILINAGNESSGCALWQSGPGSDAMCRLTFCFKASGSFSSNCVGERWAWDHSKCIYWSLQPQRRLCLCYFIL